MARRIVCGTDPSGAGADVQKGQGRRRFRKADDGAASRDDAPRSRSYHDGMTAPDPAPTDARRAEDRSARIAVTVFPLLVLAAALVGLSLIHI